MTFLFFDLKVRFFFSPPLGRPFLRKNTNSLFFCLINVARYLTDSLRGPVNKPYDEARRAEFCTISGCIFIICNYKSPLLYLVVHSDLLELYSHNIFCLIKSKPIGSYYFEWSLFTYFILLRIDP